MRTTIALCALSALLLGGTAVLAESGVPDGVPELSQQISQHPGDVDLLLRRAAIYRTHGHAEEALKDLDEVSRLAPKRRDLLLERGLVRVVQGKPALAEADFDRYLKGGAPNFAALTARGRIREADRRWASARADYDAALKLSTDVETYLARGRVDEALGRLDRAAAGYEEGLATLHGAVVIRLALIRVETARGQGDRAIPPIDEVLATAPVKADWLLRRADVHATFGHEDEAGRDRITALYQADAQLRQRPTDLARITRAKALLALGLAAEAAAALSRIVQHAPQLTEAQELLQKARDAALRHPTQK